VDRITRYLEKTPNRKFIHYSDGQTPPVTLHALLDDISRLNETLRETFHRHTPRPLVGIAMSSGRHWVLSDLAIMLYGGVALPVPLEFSDEQIRNLLQHADICLVESPDTSTRIRKLLPDTPVYNVKERVWHGDLSPAAGNKVEMVPNIIKVIHTSGTTSTPKGVLINDEGLGALIESLLASTLHIGEINYCSLVPFSLLIEQVLAIYLPLLSGGSVTLKPANVPDFSVKMGHIDDYIAHICRANCNCLFLPPLLLEKINQLLDEDKARIAPFLERSPHILTGGAKVSSTLLSELEYKGVRVYEGYGLSENSSVVSLNTPGARKLGTAGKLLPHVQAKFHDGELLIKSTSLCSGYLGTDSSSCQFDEQGFMHTGDIGKMDDQGFLHIGGRKKNIIVLSNSRNICPEWVEQIYKMDASFDEIVVVGEGKEFPSAVVFTDDQHISPMEISASFAKHHHKLPSYSQVAKFYIIHTEGWRERYFTVTGRPKRGLIEHSCIHDNIVAHSTI
jgi:long-subunit acyl-CoA synthetase (AMP-forming)